jgi:hypothetical protein
MREVDAIAQRCLAKPPDERYGDAGALAMTIRAALGGERVRTRARLPWQWIAVGIVLVITIGAAVFLLRDRTRQLDHGYDLRASDIRGDAETKRLIALALRADAEGNRPQAMELLEEAWRRPAKTAFPAAFLSSFADGAGDAALSTRWENAAKKRLDGASPYESLLVRYLIEPSGFQSQELALAKSALDVRPDAWRLRLAAAHIHLGQRDRDAARRELQQIDVTRPDDRRLMFVLADRASLGDVEGAERALRGSRLANRPAMLHYTEARIAWSRGDVRRAQQLFDRAARDATAESLAPLEVDSRLLSSMAMLRLGEWESAQRELATMANRARRIGLQHRVYEAAALTAYAAHHLGDFAERDRKLAESAAVGPPLHPRAALRLLAIRLHSPVWKQWKVRELATEPLLAATMALIRAREAADEGNVDVAKAELARARREGIEVAEEREEAELLAAELGLPSTLLPPDPPYPNLLRYLAIFDHPRTSKGTGVSR